MILENLLSVSIRALILALVAAAVLGLMRRRRSAALAHAVWTAVVFGMLGLVLIGPALPSLNLRVLREAPAPAVSAPPTAAPMAAEDLAMPETLPAARKRLTLPAMLLALYLAVAAAFLIRLSAGAFLVRKLLRASRATGSGFYESGSIAVPLTVAWLRPRIVLPQDWPAWSRAKLDAILTHERAHVRRRDALTRLVADLNQCVFWFHPLAWWLKRQVAFLAERACDEACLAVTGNREDYAELLVEMAAAVERARGRVYRHALAMASPSRMQRRIDAILNQPCARPFTRAARAALIVCSLPAIYAAGAVNLDRQPALLPLPLPRFRPPDAPALIAQAQSAPQLTASIEFEVATVKPVPPDGAVLPAGMHGGPGTSDPGRITCGSVTLKALVTAAYNVSSSLVDGPNWLGHAMFDIAAKVPEGATKEQVRVMWQNLLADRFKVTLHRETKDLPLYELTVAKGGPKLKPSASAPDALLPGDAGPPSMVVKDGRPQLAPGARGILIGMLDGRGMRLSAGAQSLAEFAARLSNGLLDGPVVDKTGIAGTYDFHVDFTTAPGADDYASLPIAVQEQLGLKLEKKTGPLDVIVVDHAEKVPTGN